MASFVDRVRAFVGGYELPHSALIAAEQKAAKTRASYATGNGARRMVTVAGNTYTRRSARLLRHFADNNEALRTAINWRKQQISRAKWRIVRIDDPERPPNHAVVKEATHLFRFINPKRESLRSLLDMAVEDTLVLDAGCIEKEKTLGGQIVALHAVDGATIAPDPDWDGTKPKAIRYRQYDTTGRLVAELRNGELIYVMENQTTHRILGWSRVETLTSIVEAELWGEKYDFEMLRQAAPAGMLDLGGGLSDDQVEAFREYYRTEIAGTTDLAIMGGGVPDRKPSSFTKFGWNAQELMRDKYKSWLINKIAFVFQIDKTIFGLVDDVNRSTGKTMSDRTDQGFVTLAELFSEYVSREIIWEFDEDHAFEFTDLLSVDKMEQAKVDQIHMLIGYTTPNELRARDGKKPFPKDDEDAHWADLPYTFDDPAANTEPEDHPLEGDDEEGDGNGDGKGKPPEDRED